MRFLLWILRLLLLVLFLSFAIKNTDPVAVRYFLGWEWRAPLSLVLLIFFVAGAALGVIAAGSWLYRHRREILQLRRELRARDNARDIPEVGPERRLL
jgi:lipopolysaccharide assembly protein A